MEEIIKWMKEAKIDFSLTNMILIKVQTIKLV